MLTDDNTRPQFVEELTRSIAPMQSLGGTSGYVEEVNGPGAWAVPEFVPSRHELVILLKYWVEIVCHIRFELNVLLQTGSDSMRREVFACMRMKRIAQALRDDEAVASAWDAVEEQFTKDLDPLTRKIFMEQATPAEKARFREELHRRFQGTFRNESRDLK